MPWKAVTLNVELDLAEKGENNPRWVAVRFLFVRGLKEPGDVDASKKDWALFLTTDIQLSMSKTLGGLCFALGHRGLFQGSEAASWLFAGSNGHVRIAHGLDTPVCNTLSDAGA